MGKQSGSILAALLAAGFQATGIDLSEAMLVLAIEKHPTAQFVAGDLCELNVTICY